jgi:hypothetical protein
MESRYLWLFASPDELLRELRPDGLIRERPG